MPINDERRVSVTIPIVPELDPRATKKVIRDTSDLIKRLSAAKVDFKELSKIAGANVKQINDMAKAADIFSSRLTKGAKTSYDRLKELGKELEAATKQADDLQKLYKTAKTKTARSEIDKQRTSQARLINTLNKQINIAQGRFQKYGDELSKVQKSQQKYHRNIEQLSKFSGKDMREGLKQGLRQMFAGGKAGGIAGLGTVASSLGRGAAGAVARKNLAGAAAGGKQGADAMLNMRNMSMLAGSLAGIAVVMGTLIKLIQMASNHQAKLNKSLLEGVGTANDFTGSTDKYADAVHDVRNAAIDSTAALLKFGIQSEDSLKTINNFAKETTGSIVRTRNELIKLGKGDAAKGVEIFSRNAIAYGKALGMEMTEVGSMMGNFVGEVGYNATNVQTLMQDIVSTAASSGMPVYKFMDIFRQTIPQIELFTNRIEELAGTVKILSKNMSPEQVKEFMNAWSQGLKYDSFQSRLKKTLIVGVDKTNSILAKGFSSKADVIAAQLGDDLGDEFKSAFKSGDMQKVFGVITKAQSRGVGSPALFGQMTQLMQAEKARQRGGPLGTASAMKGASMMDQIKFARAQLQTITGNQDLSGLNEHVMEQLGYDQKQIEALKSFSATIGNNIQSLKTYGATTSKSINEALIKIIQREKEKRGDKTAVTRQDMANATEDQIMAATELSIKDQKAEMTAQDLAAKQFSMTSSIDEKITNVVSFWLEKIFQLLQPAVDAIDKIWQWLSGNDEQKKNLKTVEDWQRGVEKTSAGKEGFYTATEFSKQMRIASDAMNDSLNSGKRGVDLGQGIGGAMSYLKPSVAQMSPEGKKSVTDYLIGRAGSTGMGGVQADHFAKSITDALESGDMGKAFGNLSTLNTDDVTEMQEFAKMLATQFGVSDAAKGILPSRRAGTQDVRIPKKFEELTEEVSDTFNAEKLGVMTSATASDPAGAVPAITDSIESGSGNEGVEDRLGQQKKVAEEQNKNLLKLDKKMATGVRVDASDKTQKVINTATLDAFRIALTEYAIHEARMASNPEYAAGFLDPDEGIVGSGQTLGALSGLPMDTRADVFDALSSGGPGVGRTLSGGGVLSQRAASDAASSPAQLPAAVHAEVHLHGTNIGPQQAQRMVEHAVGHVMRRH